MPAALSWSPRIVSLLSGEGAERAGRVFDVMECEAVTLDAPAEPEATLLFIHRLRRDCDVLVLPLSHDKAVSLHIARQVHRQNAPFRTLLFTGSPTATRESTVPLFDDMLPLTSDELLPRLLSAAMYRAPARLSVDAVERQIGRLIQVENCFWRERLPASVQTSLAELTARDRRYVAAMDELARMTMRR